MTSAAERAKFFDLVIPIVPFVSTEVSGSLLVEEFAGVPDDERPSTSVLEVVGRYFPDMRVLRNVRNEFGVYFDQLIRRGTVELDRDRLFALLAFKHAHPIEFDRIRIGESSLDALTKNMEAALRRRLRGIDRDLASSERQVRSEHQLVQRAANAGARLTVALDFLSSRAGSRGEATAVSLEGSEFNRKELANLSFWKQLDRARAAHLNVTFANGGSAVARREVLEALLPDDFPPAEWIEDVQVSTIADLDRLKALRADLKRSDWATRLQSGRFDGVGLEQDGSEVAIVFEAIAKDVLGDALAFEMIVGGFIRDDFPLYTSKYHEALVSGSAQSFRIQFISRRRTSLTHQLAPRDVDEIRAKLGDGFLEEASVLNLSIFDRLLGDTALGPAVRKIAAEEFEDARDFVRLYLVDGKRPEALVRELTPLAPWMLVLIADLEISSSQRQGLIADALVSIRPDVDYESSDRLRQEISTTAANSFKPFGRGIRRGTAAAVVKVMRTNGAQVRCSHS